jgi:type II secretory ATPase GspE/PulE/Tfp pilus assembly ATPase PilB-like protein
MALGQGGLRISVWNPQGILLLTGVYKEIPTGSGRRKTKTLYEKLSPNKIITKKP